MLLRHYVVVVTYCGAGVMGSLDLACPNPPSGGFYDHVPWDFACWVAFPGIGIASILIIVAVTLYFLMDKVIRKITSRPNELIPREYLDRAHWDLSRVLAHISYVSKQGWAIRREVLLASIASWFAVKAFNDGAYGNSLHSKGRPRSYANYEDVDPTYWRSAKVADIEALTPKGVVTRTEPRKFFVGGIQHYDDFLFSEDDVLAIWPPAPLLQRVGSWITILSKRTWLELQGIAQWPVHAMWRYWRRKGRI